MTIVVVVLGGSFLALALLGVLLNFALGGTSTTSHTPEQWPLTYDFDHRSSDMGLGDRAHLSATYTDGGLLMTVKAAGPPPKYSGVNFWSSHPRLAVQMDMTRRSGPIAGTAYGPSCWTGDKYFTFLVSDDGTYRLQASDYSSATFATSATRTLTTGTDPSLAGARARRLRIECVPTSSTMAITTYADGRLVATAETPARTSRSLNSNLFIRGAAVAQTTGPPAQIFIDNFRAENV